MKTCLKLERWTIAGCALLLGALMAMMPARLPAAATPAEPAVKSHTLFMGADVAIERDKAFHPVRDVSGGAFLITVNGEPVFVPTNLRSVNLRIDQSLKLTTSNAAIEQLKGERAYTPANDPNRKFLNDAGNAAAGAAMVSQASGAVTQVEFAASAAGGSPAGVSSEVQQAVAAAYSQLGAATYSLGSDLNNTGNYAMRLQEELAKELFDAVELSFAVSSPVPLNNPYLLLITQFREPDAKQGMVRSWIYAKSLDPITAKPRKIHVLQGGFPPGFQLVAYRLHLYNQGQEIATNVSSKRVELSGDEAFEYLLIEHLTRHKGASVAPSPALAELPADFQARLAPGLLAQPLYARVAKDGKVVGTFLDKDCQQPVGDAYLDTVVRSIRFKPGLDQGKPVEGVAPLVLDKLKL